MESLIPIFTVIVGVACLVLYALHDGKKPKHKKSKAHAHVGG